MKERGSPLELLSKLKREGSLFLQNNSSKLALDDLGLMFEALDKAKCINKVVFDLSLARGLDYYTGVIFEAVFKGATQVISVFEIYTFRCLFYFIYLFMCKGQYECISPPLESLMCYTFISILLFVDVQTSVGWPCINNLCCFYFATKLFILSIYNIYCFTVRLGQLLLVGVMTTSLGCLVLSRSHQLV